MCFAFLDQSYHKMCWIPLSCTWTQEGVSHDSVGRADNGDIFSNAWESYSPKENFVCKKHRAHNPVNIDGRVSIHVLTHHLISFVICTKLFQNVPFYDKVFAQKTNPYVKRQRAADSEKMTVDLWFMYATHHLIEVSIWLIYFKSTHQWQSHGPD